MIPLQAVTPTELAGQYFVVSRFEIAWFFMIVSLCVWAFMAFMIMMYEKRHTKFLVENDLLRVHAQWELEQKLNNFFRTTPLPPEEEDEPEWVEKVKGAK